MTHDYEEFDDVKSMVNYLEEKYEITVISIRDYGSRAWNLDSETSDMDAGMVYTQKPIDYIELGGYTQNIDRKFYVEGEEFELIGWNIDRFAELLNKSNPSMIEWLNSQIRYYELLDSENLDEAENFFKEIRMHANQEFKPIALWGHYRDMGKANYQKYIENRNDLSIKRHLYILRGLTYAKYVLETHRRPPLDFQKFYNDHLSELGIDDMVYQYIGEFIKAKTSGEGHREIADEELWRWMEKELDKEIEHSKHNVRGIDREKINEAIKKCVPR